MSRKAQRSNHRPSTPNRQSHQSQPSTTPLVPPPSYLTNKSTTPAGPPPKSVFGSSFNPANATFRKSHSGSALKSFTLPDSSPPRSMLDDLPEPDTQLEDASIDDLQLFGRHSNLMSSIGTGVRGLKRSRDGRAKRQSDYSAIASSWASQRRPQSLSDELVLATEQVLDNSQMRTHARTPEDIAPKLINAWRKLYPASTREGGIGPAADDDNAVAAYIATFALQMHSAHQGMSSPGKPTIPRALLHWLDTWHNPFPDDFDTILTTRPAPSANESFWDVIYSSLLRGRFDRAIKLLQTAGWEHAVTALDDDATTPGYSGQQLENTRRCARQCIDLLASSPSRDDDWNVSGTEWSLFRQRVRIVFNNLQSLAGETSEGDEDMNIFSRSVQGSFNFSVASKKAGSKVPWTIFENLKTLYGQLLGKVDEILTMSQDWLEATVFLTVWWDGNEDADSFIPSKSVLRNESEGTREVDVAPSQAYRDRLGDAFTLAVEQPIEPGFSVDSTDPAQIGLACAVEDDVNGVLSVLQSLSLPIAAAVADIAAAGAWYLEPRLTPKRLAEHGFDSQDLFVLSQGPRSNQHDDILSAYADLLATEDVIKSGDIRQQGWEIAISVYGRLLDTEHADQKISELLDRLKLDSVDTTDKVLLLCSELGLTEQAKRVAERFADGLQDSNETYGAKLVFYARAHAFEKLDSTLALLTSYCLVQSLAVPLQSKLDEQLDSLLGDRIELLALGEADAEAGEYLASQLSGYATARRFYDLRDNHKDRRSAAIALLSLIASASDCIRGGLLDPSVQSVVPVDGILVLLGELLPFCHQHQRTLTPYDIFTILRVIEDFTACPNQIRDAAEDVLRACREAYGSPVPSLNKSKSDASTSSGLSGSSYELLMASSSMLDKMSDQTVERAWDWRKGLAGIADLNAQSFLLLLRTALAEELGKAWIAASA